MKNFRNEIIGKMDGKDQIQQLTYLTSMIDSIESTMESMYDSMEPGAVCYIDMIVIRDLREKRTILKELVERYTKD